VTAVVRGANGLLEDHQRVWSTSIWPGETLPRTEGTQKLKRREIQGWAAGLDRGGRPEAPHALSVAAVVGRFASGREIGPETTLDELGLSSLDRVEMIMALEEAFQVTLDEGILADARTIADLETGIRGSGGPRGSGSEGPEDLAEGPSAKTAPGTRGAEGPKVVGAEGPRRSAAREGGSIRFPSWNRSALSWFVRRISLPTWILPLARVFMQLRVDGLEHLATIDGPVVFAANHQSHMDVPAILCALPPRWRYRIAPAMAKEFFRAHFYPGEASRKAWLTNSLNYYLACQFFGAFPLPQREAGTRQTLRYIGEVAADRYSILIFPEGRRREEGEIDPFRPGVGMIGSRLDLPVVPVLIEGLDKVLHPKMRWPKRGPVRIAFGAPMRLRGDDFPALARKVEDAVRGLAGSLRSPGLRA
jgi:long-chain acyl-CoA synthetase